MSSNNKLEAKASSKWLRARTKSLKKNVLLVSLIGTSSGILLIFQVYFIAHIANAAYLDQQSANTLTFDFISIIVLMILRGVLIWLKDVVSFKTSCEIRTSLQAEVTNKIASLGPIKAKNFSTGQLVSNTFEQIEALHNYLVHYLPQMSIAVYLPIAILIFVFPVSLVSGLILLICAPLIPFFMMLVGMGAESIHQRHFQNLAKMSNHFLDTLSGLITLKLFDKSKDQEKSIYETSENYRKTTMQVLRVAFLSSAILEVFSAVSIAILAVYLGMGFLNEGTQNPWWWSISDINLTSALFILLLAPEFFLPLRELSTHYHARAEAIGATSEIRKLLEYNVKEEKGKRQSISFDLNNHPILFDQISTSYQLSTSPILDRVTFELKPKQTLMLLGPTGSGKSTILNLLLKFIEPTHGCIKIGSSELSDIDSKNWYQQISWLGQAPKLFSGSLYDNLKMAKPDATDSEINTAIDQAELSQFINHLPQKLQTQIGDNQLGLSGGQAQRVALARALLKNASLFILDEPTQSLDVEHEYLIMDMLSNKLKDKTVIMATHRLEHLKLADHIIVLDKGQITQQGSYDELINQPSGYLKTLLKLKEETSNV
ncbi:thiol reductant ABC exporter subunit CydD [Thiotrichales bacterium 19S9-12]|nr:thiol reductant ABC exporter subunit CydD [Thiotrichales bacterium 19S9-11]MCF6812419.1 thiol reductant ABC exporter subunit CydD [Thiotrichales bacterium 19S9-12]